MKIVISSSVRLPNTDGLLRGLLRVPRPAARTPSHCRASTAKTLTSIDPDNRTATDGAEEASKKALYAANPSSEPDTLTIHKRRSASSMAATSRRISQTLEEALREQNQGTQIEEHLDLSTIHQTLVRDLDGQGFNPADLQAANPRALADKIASNPE
jgi:hypothetical protein